MNNIVFFVGIIYRVVQWGKSPVPFRIPSTCAQQKSLPWIKYGYAEKLDNPVSTAGVVGRMILEVLCFRSQGGGGVPQGLARTGLMMAPKRGSRGGRSLPRALGTALESRGRAQSGGPQAHNRAG